MKNETIEYNASETYFTMIVAIVLIAAIFYFIFSLYLGRELLMLWLVSNMFWVVGAVIGLYMEFVGLSNYNKTLNK